MTFYLLRNDLETGPFSWVEVYLMLRNGELDYSDSARSEDENEFQSIEALGFWNEGTDVGPLTWEEILLLRQEAAVEGNIPAKIEGEDEFSTLEKLLLDRPELARVAETPAPLHSIFAGKWWIPTSIAATALLFAGVGWMLYSESNRPSGQTTAPVARKIAEATPTIEPSVPPHAESAVQQTTSTDSQRSAPEGIASNRPVTEQGEASFSHPVPTPAQEISVPSELIASISPTPDELPTQGLARTEPVPAVPQEPAIPSESATPKADVVSVTPTPAPTPMAKPTPQLSEVTSNFFEIHSIKPLTRPPKDNIGVWKVEKNARGREEVKGFIQCLEVQVSAKDGIAAKDVFARAYFFDRSRYRVASYKEPSKAGPKSNARALHSMPVIFNADSKERLFFEIPPELIGQGWQVVVVFGDKEEAKAITYPHGSSYAMLDFPEKQLVNDRSIRAVRRKRVEDRVIEYVAKTKNPKHPQITLFLRPPKGIEDWSEVKGVYALVVLANSVDDIRRRMQAIELDGDEAGSFAFANKHKLAILMWGSRSIWNARMNYDDYDQREAREKDRDFDMVANAWEDAIQHFHKEYGTPTSNFILRGNCGAAQWAKRLCLRKPDYFLAAHIHLAGSYDKPTPEAAKVLWCVTTTEQDGGYERSLRFLTAAREMGYPIIYKAATPQSGIGSLGDQFFEFAMTLKDKRAAYEQELSSKSRQVTLTNEGHQGPWADSFADPPFYADVVNQEVLPAEQLDMIPESFRSVIPTKGLAEVWK